MPTLVKLDRPPPLIWMALVVEAGVLEDGAALACSVDDGKMLVGMTTALVDEGVGAAVTSCSGEMGLIGSSSPGLDVEGKPVALPGRDDV